MIARFHSVALAASALSMLLGGSVLLGWFLEIAVLKSVVPGFQTMKPNTAAAFLLAGASLGLQVRPSTRPPRIWLARLCSSAVLAIGLLTLLEYWQGIDLGIDHLLLSAAQGERLRPEGGPRMALNTALTLTLLGAAIALTDSKLRPLRAATQSLAIAAFIIAYVACVGYAYSVTAFYGVAGYSSMALHSALGLAVLSTGVLSARPERGVTAILAQGNSAGRGGRRILPLLLIAVAALAWIVLQGQHARYYGAEFGLALMVTMTTSMLAAIVLWSVYHQGLSESERQRVSEQFRMAIEAAPTGMIVVDRAGTIVLLNAQIERMFGYSRAELIGKSIEALVPEQARGRHPALRATFFHAPHARPMGAGRTVVGLRNDGREFPVEVALSPLKTTDGHFVLGSVVDVLERQEIERSTERDRFFQLSIDMMCIANTAGRFLQLNPAFEQVLGYSIEELLAKPFLEFVHPDDIAATQREIEAHLQGGKTIDFKNRYRRNDGSYRWLQWRSMPDLTGLMYAVARDVTDETKATEALRQTLREREVLLQEIHHRVKNNLQVIASLINMQVRKVTDRSTRDALEECQTRVQSIALIHEKLYQSKDYSRVPFWQYASSLAETIFHAMGVSADRVALALDIDRISLPVDRAIPCGLILNELITNALKHAFPGQRHGVIRVELRKAADHELRLAVADDGVGLPLDLDVENSKSLGLQLVFTLVEQLNGRVAIGRARGTEFSVTFSAETSS